MYLGVHPRRWPVYGDQADTVAWSHWSAADQDEQGVCQDPACFEVPSSDVTRHRPAHSSASVPPFPDTPVHPSYKLHLLNIQRVYYPLVACLMSPDEAHDHRMSALPVL